MGQYYKIVNTTKKQYIDPWVFGNGNKLLELTSGSYMTAAALCILLADGNGEGGGDLHSDNKIIGSWANCRIVVAGSYADKNKFMTPKEKLIRYPFAVEDEINLYSLANLKYKDVSLKVLDAMFADHYIWKDYFDNKQYIYNKATLVLIDKWEKKHAELVNK